MGLGLLVCMGAVCTVAEFGVVQAEITASVAFKSIVNSVGLCVELRRFILIFKA